MECFLEGWTTGDRGWVNRTLQIVGGDVAGSVMRMMKKLGCTLVLLLLYVSSPQMPACLLLVSFIHAWIFVVIHSTQVNTRHRRRQHRLEGAAYFSEVCRGKGQCDRDRTVRSDTGHDVGMVWGGLSLLTVVHIPTDLYNHARCAKKLVIWGGYRTPQFLSPLP